MSCGARNEDVNNANKSHCKIFRPVNRTAETMVQPQINSKTTTNNQANKNDFYYLVRTQKILVINKQSIHEMWNFLRETNGELYRYIVHFTIKTKGCFITKIWRWISKKWAFQLRERYEVIELLISPRKITLSLSPYWNAWLRYSNVHQGLLCFFWGGMIFQWTGYIFFNLCYNILPSILALFFFNLR